MSIGTQKVEADLFPGYETLECIHASDDTRIYRARRNQDGLPVILKSFGVGTVSREAIARMRYEYELLVRMNDPHIIRPVDLFTQGGLPVLVLEDIGGISLDRILTEGPLSLEAALRIGVQIATGLAALHASQVIHKDMNPSNIVLNARTGELRIVDLGLATFHMVEHLEPASSQAPPGTLEYMSPEQTGRMNRTLDYRSDLYSLGATLHRMLTGKPLFDVDAPIEWFHCHIACKPEPPVLVNPQVPAMVSDIVMKLLSKAVQERYQSAVGLSADLHRCLAQWQQQGKIEAFELAQRDAPGQFHLPQHLYGREREVQSLLQAFEEARGGLAIALVTGPAGVGKSRLISEIRQPVTAKDGHFCRGKFDQQQQQRPYSGLIMALRDLLRQVLTESAEQVELWKQQLIGTLGSNCRLLIELVPELERVVGPQPPLPEVPPLESEQRLRLSLFGFFRVFAREDHPLVVVLDDLQWADAGTLQLFDLLVDVTREGHLLLVTAFRADEILPGHLLLEGLAKLKNSRLSITHISLQPLELTDVNHMLSAATHLSLAAAEPFSRLVLDKTGGNPFFIEQFVDALYREGHIRFEVENQCWLPNLNAIEAEDSTDNVIDLMTVKLGQLPPQVQDLVKLAACAGNRFKLDTIAKAAGVEPVVVAKGLRQAGAQGLVIPVQDAFQLIELDQATFDSDLTVEFAFVHDRVQQTAYDLLSPSERARAHLVLGRLLLDQHNDAAPDRELFDLVHHLHVSSELLTELERREVCRLNFEAGKRAKYAAAQVIAAEHFGRSLNALGADAWQSDYALTRDLHAQLAETAFLRGRYIEMDALVGTGLEHARTLLDKIDFHELQITACIVRGELLKAISIARPVLTALGERYPANPNRGHVVLKVLQLKRRLGKNGLGKIRALPMMTSPEKLAALRIGGSLGSVAMFAQPMLLPLMVLQSVITALEHGLAPQIGTSCCMIGVLRASSIGDVQGAEAFGRLGMEICDRADDPRYQGRAQHLYSSLIEYWTRPLNATLNNLRQAAATCKGSGDFEYALHATSIFTKYAFLAGADLVSLEHELATNIDSFNELRQGALIYHLRALHQLCLNFMGRAADPRNLAGDAYNLDRTLSHHRQSNDLTLIQTALSCQTWTSYNFDENDGRAALVFAQRTAQVIEGARGFYSFYWYHYIDALVRLRVAFNAPEPESKALLAAARRRQKVLARAASRCPHNFSSKLLIIEAETLRVRGNDFAAHARFDAAIAEAAQQQFLGDQALANELCGLMHMAAGRTTLGLPYVREACDLYRRWGALGKVAYLESRYRGLARLVATPSRGSMVPMDNLTVASLMKGLKAIANEQIHSRMVTAVMRVALEFAGAQRGILALRNTQGELCIEAESEVDSGEMHILQSSPLSQSHKVAQPLVNYVIHTCSGVVVHDAGETNATFPKLKFDRHVLADKVKSIMCLPLLIGSSNETELVGLLYLENNRATDCFTDKRFDTLETICVAAAGRLELSRRATVDGLTDLFNHEYFQNMLRQECASAKRHGRELGLVLLDVDHFKAINDTYGHQAGDQVLRELGRLLKSASREGDTVARYGGEEMVMILPNTGLEEAVAAAQRLREAIQALVVLYGETPIVVSASLGLAMFDIARDEPATLIRQADAALYRSKAEGRNRLSVAGLN